jgi:hypothetical protein
MPYRHAAAQYPRPVIILAFHGACGPQKFTSPSTQSPIIGISLGLP